MQVSKQFLLDAVGLILTISLILTGVRLYRKAEQAVGILEKRQSRQLQNLEEYEVVKYEGYYIDGTTVLGYIRNLVGNYDLPVTVTTGKGTFRITERSQCANLRNKDSEQYINPLGTYLCEVLRDENSAIVGASLVYFERGEK